MVSEFSFLNGSELFGVKRWQTIIHLRNEPISRTNQHFFLVSGYPVHEEPFSDIGFKYLIKLTE